MIQCPNYNCQASNADGSQFCQQCQAPLPRRLLWAVGQHADAFKPGMLVADRYLCQASRIFLDTQPGIPPGTLSELPETVLPYLHLISHQIHLPQIYGWADANLPSRDVKTRLMFLENGALLTVRQPAVLGSSLSTIPHHASPPPPGLLPSLKSAWPQGSATQQLQWLWQIVQLWSPLFHENVASTLLIDEFVRVEGPLIRLVQIQYWRPEWDHHISNPGHLALTQPLPCTLEQLGKCWSNLVPEASPQIQPFLADLCHQLTHQIDDIYHLLFILEEVMAEVEQSQTLTLHVATRTDQGPSRSNNEDACFPTSGSAVQLSQLSTGHSHAPIVVCDGIGGHHGGDIASSLAIETIIQAFQSPDQQMERSPTTIESGLKQIVGQANDAISDLNDQEQRRDRQRMGTTLVMAWLQGHNCYLTHIGDSRAYWITQWGCHQITLDDDVASREARLGYGTYRSVLYHPNSGALVQALGMGSSQNLYPTVQRLILEGQGLLLLCSDGLSDQDLIDVCWESILLPVLNGQITDLDLVSQQLV
ncbi:MAG: serine/threonine protein phosphatase, partial [Symploca sp. SIO2B6]|nr:serine/threonine protein phosphatase [Symploca sp. SIO2B6]